jgi:RHS repeat-associated protein
LRYYPWGEVRWASGTTPTDYRFTGQMQVASIGLYFYNARWYDSALGRFIQADTIIPNPGDPPSFDRFAYVRNDPIKYIDPSGHNLNCGLQGSHAAPEDCAEADPEGDGIPYTGPEQVAPVQLTEAGIRMYSLYWTLYRMASGDFSMLDFLTLILTRELYSMATDEDASGLFKEAAVRWFYTNWETLSDNAIFNWVGAGLQSAGGNGLGGLFYEVFIGKNSYTQIVGQYSQYAGAAREAAQAILAPPIQWTQPDPNRPYTWGNISLLKNDYDLAVAMEAEYADDLLNLYTDIQGQPRLGTTDFNSLMYYQYGWYIATLNQSEYWRPHPNGR